MCRAHARCQAEQAVGWAAQRTCYVLIQFFQKLYYLFFVHNLDKFQLVFPIQNYPTKFLFRKQKSKRIASEKYKVHEFFIRVFPLQID